VSDASVYQRIVRRETHSSRSGLAVAVAIVLILVLAWVGTEAVLAAVGQPALLVAPTDMVSGVLGAASGATGIVTAIAIVVAVVGLVLVVLSLAPGRKGRRGSTSGRAAVVVDDRVIARHLARTASHAGEVDPSAVRVTVGKRRADVDVQAVTGRTTDTRVIEEALREELQGYDLTPPLTAKVRLSKKGKVDR